MRVVHEDVVEDDDNITIYKKMNGVLQYVTGLFSSYVSTLKKNIVVYAYVL